jgi:hypothetical protein
VVSSKPRQHFTPGNHTVPTLQEAGWAPRPVWTGAENLASTGIRSPDGPTRSKSRDNVTLHIKETRHLLSSINLVGVVK